MGVVEFEGERGENGRDGKALLLVRGKNKFSQRNALRASE